MIETERLLLRPLTYGQLLKYMKADHSLEAELNLHPVPMIISPELQEALEQTILPSVADPDRNYLYSTLWTMIWKQENKMVGDLCFIGEPDAEGEIEIGYGTYEAFQNMGFMTEAVGGMIRWAEAQPAVKSIRAATEKDNAASYSVLLKNNFVQYEAGDTQLKWRLRFK
jgi:RimJ/RimL family protein N-acetyltransferase